MPASTGLIKGLNGIRQVASSVYKDAIGVINTTDDISCLSQPILENPQVMNEFVNNLVHKLAYQKFNTKFIRNPLQVLEGDTIPLGFAGEEIHVNPAKAKRYNSEDFAGILQNYEADVKVQYHNINMDLQYPVTVSRTQLLKAFVSWQNLEDFITTLTNSLYSGAYLNSFEYTKNIVTNTYIRNLAPIEVIDLPTNKESANAFVEKLRTHFLNFQLPSSKYNAWKKCGGTGRPVTTITEAEDIVVLVRNDIHAKLDVEVLAKSFNMDKATLLGNLLPVDNFDVYNDEGEIIYNGSKIIGIICDKSWFRIKTQEMYMETSQNASARATTYFLNLIKMYNFSLFANGIIFATEEPSENESVLIYDANTDFNTFTVSQLKLILDELKIDYAGKTLKADLITLLQEYYQ